MYTKEKETITFALKQLPLQALERALWQCKYNPDNILLDGGLIDHKKQKY